MSDLADDARNELLASVVGMLPIDDVPTLREAIDALLTDDNFNNVIRVLGGKVAGLDQRMRVEWGSSVLFKQGGDLYER